MYLHQENNESISMRLEALEMHKVTWNCDRFIQAHLSNDCPKDVHGSTTRFHQRAWKCYLVSSMCMEVAPTSSKCVEVHGGAWNRMDAHPISCNQCNQPHFFHPTHHFHNLQTCRYEQRNGFIKARYVTNKRKRSTALKREERNT